MLVAVAYLPVLDGDFLLDDYGLGLLTDGQGNVDWGKTLRYFFPSHLTRDQFLRPFPVLLGALDLRIWGANPWGFHLTNLLIHLLGALLTGMLARRLSRNPWVGPITTLVYGLYPGHTEAVAWIIHRMVGMTVVFYLLTLLLHTRRRLRPLAWLTALVALLCKEPAANLPAAVFLLHFYLHPAVDVRERVFRAVRNALPYVAVVLVYLVWKQLAFHGVVTGYGKYDTYFDYFLGEKIYRDLPGSFLRFVSPVHGELLPRLAVWGHAMVTVVGIGLLAVYSRWREQSRHVVLFGLALAVLSLLLVFPFLSVPAGLTNARHFSVPAVGLAMAVGALLAGVPRRGRVMAAVWLMLYFAPLPVNLVPFLEAGQRARAVRLGVERWAASYPPETLVVVARTPSMVHGAPVFGDGSSLGAALRPPFTRKPYRLLPIMDLDDPPQDVDGILLGLQGSRAVLVVEQDGARGEFVVREVSPPVDSWRVFAPEQGIEIVAPEPGARLVLNEDPPFVFRSRESFRYYRLVFEVPGVVLPVLVQASHLESTPDGCLIYRLSRGDVYGADYLNRPEIQQVQGEVSWYVEGVRDPTRPRSAVARSIRSRFRVGAR